MLLPSMVLECVVVQGGEQLEASEPVIKPVQLRLHLLQIQKDIFEYLGETPVCPA